MIVRTVTDVHHPALPFIKSLYEISFPLHERRHWEQLVSMITTSFMKLELIEADDKYIGFVLGWNIGNWYYVEHLAIDPMLRGIKYGSTVMQQLIDRAARHIVLEVEYPYDDTSRRRIPFYQQLGFSLLPFPYKQPPYRKEEAPISMHLMSIPAITEKAVFDNLAQSIKETVYEAYY